MSALTLLMVSVCGSGAGAPTANAGPRPVISASGGSHAASPTASSATGRSGRPAPATPTSARASDPCTPSGPAPRTRATDPKNLLTARDPRSLCRPAGPATPG
ncbi:hypothetical protein Sm713_73310 [Streptomyces sp. TS71-3]|nr:hypothetical protein Sm713_73310 [Streptomyces sp. TS71-3]